MGLPLASKVGLFTAILSVSLTSGGLWLFYTSSAKLLTDQITKRLQDIGTLASLNISLEEQEAISYLSQQSLSKLAVSESEILAIPQGEFLPGLTSTDSKKLMESPQFQHLVQFLRRIEYSALGETNPPTLPYSQLSPSQSQLGTYLFISIPQNTQISVVMFIADSRYEPDGDWLGNPVGNLYYGIPKFKEVFNGQAQVSDINQDDLGVWLTAMIPLKDSQGKVYASIGLDYDLSSEANRLRTLQLICLGILCSTLFIAVLVSVGIACWLGKPLTELQKAAILVKNKDFSVNLNLNSKDELGFLAQIFNEMVTELREYSTGLENKVKERTQELEKANQEIQSLNDRLRQENLRMSGELEVTRKLQKMILPGEDELKHFAELDIAGYMEPAAEVGGDYYDILNDNGRLIIGIGDVTGHGLESGVLMLMAQTAVRALQAANILDHREFMNAINQTLYGNIQRMNSDKNMTLAILEYDRGALTLFGQHEEMIVVRNDGKVERFDTFDLGFPIGLEADIEKFVAQVKIQLKSNDIAVLYTDGIIEAENHKKEMYGLDRICKIVKENRHKSAQMIRSTLVLDLNSFIGNHTVFDDVTLVILKQI